MIQASRLRLFSGLLCGMLLIAPAQADGVDRPRGWEAELEGGLIQVDDDSARFGDFTGLEDSGSYLLLNGTARYWGDDGILWNFDARQLGLDSRELRIDGGKQGLYDAYFVYDETPRYFYDDTVSPFIGFGSSNLTLPANWVRAGSTQGMTALGASLRPVSLEYSRDTLGLGGSFRPGRDSRWDLAFDYTRSERDGSRLYSGSIGDIAQFAEPLDDVTDNVHLGLLYAADSWQVGLDYNGSFYANDNDALTWENPFTGPPGADFGRHALTPDSDFHQLSVSGSSFLPLRTTLTGSVALGRMSQDQAFLPYTINDQVQTQPLPRASFDGEVDTTDVTLRATSNVWQRLTLTGEFRKNERANDSPRNTYDYIQTDLGPAGGPATNVPYSYDKQVYRLRADYRLLRRTRLIAGVEREDFDRDYQERHSTQTDKFWLKLNGAPHRMIDFSITGRFEDRDGSDYVALPGDPSPQNPLMRKYNMADRERAGARFDANLRPMDRLTFNLNAEYTDDDYRNSAIGLREAERTLIGGNLSLTLLREAYVYALYNWEDYESQQAGSQTFGDPDWLGENNDTFQTFVVGLTMDEVLDNLDLRIDYTWAESGGETTVRVPGTNSSYPDLETRLGSFKVYFDYHWSPSTTVRFGYWHESFRSSDWQLDGVSPATLPNLLSLGAQSQRYNQDVLWGSVSFAFGGGRAAP